MEISIVDCSLAKGDFSDTREFAAKRWEDAVFALNESLSAAGKSPSVSSVSSKTTDY
jgi:hypothetical protein